MVRGGTEANVQEHSSSTLAGVKLAMQRALEQHGTIPPAIEVQVHRAVDLLRREPVGPEPLRRMERLSCLLHQMNASLLGGRCNAYASSLVRLRREVAAI